MILVQNVVYYSKNNLTFFRCHVCQLWCSCGECIAVFVACGILFFDDSFSCFFNVNYIKVRITFAPFNFKFSRVICVDLFVGKKTTSETN